MKTTNHTPGPWENMGFYISARNASLPLPNSQCIAKASPNHDRVGGDTLANARLIASAPELLSALIKLEKASRNVLDTSATHDGIENCKTLLEARIAIAKAKGEKTCLP